MTVITLAQVKTTLGLVAGTYDAAIAATIPRVDAIVKRITKNRYNMQLLGTVTSGSADISIATAYGYNGVLCLGDYGCVGLKLTDIITNGQQVEGTGIPSGTFVTDVYSHGVEFGGPPTVRISANATASGSITIMTGIPVDLQTIIAQGIWYLISGDLKKPIDESWTSKSMGPMSVSRSDGNKIDGASGMPMWFIRAFPAFQGGF